MRHFTLLTITAAAIGLASCSDTNQGGFELKGKFKNGNGERLILEKLSQQPIAVDSAIVDSEGNFVFENYVPKIGFYRIKVSEENFAMLVLDSSQKVMVTGDIKDLGNTYKVEGSDETSLFMEFTDVSRKRDKRVDSLNQIAQSLMEPFRDKPEKLDSISATFEAPYNAIMRPVNDEIASMIDKHADMYASLIAVQSLEPDNYGDVYRKLDVGLSKKYPNDKNVKNFHDFVARTLALSIGEMAPDIELADPDGKPLKLSSFRGKVVLIDFWASWCGPCRKEMPNVVKAYAKYKNKGFEIFGVSLDKDKANWVEAIKTDGITWPQVSDLQQWNSSVVNLYAIQGIPYTVLLDKEGKILAKNLRGDELDKKLAEILK